MKIKELFKIDKKPTRGLIPMEWAVVAYIAVTLLMMLFMATRLHSIDTMLMLRMRAVLFIAVGWGVYRLVPCRMTMLLRLVLMAAMLGDWYSETYEFNRILPNLDHVFAQWELDLFGCQPSIEFSRLMPWAVVSEPLCLGYVAYFPIIAFTAAYYFFRREAEVHRACFTIMASFFLFYILFELLPVAGPTFYFKAVGIDIIEQGVYPNIGHYFEFHSDLTDDCLVTPGWSSGIFWNLVEIAKAAGERPTAAFPSSHVGMCTVALCLLWKARSPKVFYSVLPLGILMFFATFYIQAHYLIDAIVGLFAGILLFFVTYYGYSVVFTKNTKTTKR